MNYRKMPFNKELNKS